MPQGYSTHNGLDPMFLEPEVAREVRVRCLSKGGAEKRYEVSPPKRAEM